MSRRFGRNQRRRAREALASKTQELTIQGYELQATKHELGEERVRASVAGAVMDALRAVLGDESVALPAAQRMIGNVKLEVMMRYIQHEPMSFDLSDASPFAVLTENLAGLLEANVSKDHWARRGHFEAVFKGDPVAAYYIDLDVFRLKKSDFANSLIECEVSRQLARMFMEKMRGGTPT